MASPRLAPSPLPASRGIDWSVADGFGQVRERKDGRIYVCFGRYGKIYTSRGAPFEKQKDARHVLMAVRTLVAQGIGRQQAVDQWLPTASRANRFSRWLPEWVHYAEDLVASGDRGASHAADMRRWCSADGHIGGFWFGRSIYSVSYSTLREWDRWLVGRGLSPKSRHNIMGALHSMFRWLVTTEVVDRIPPFPWPRLEEYAPTIVSEATQQAILQAIPEDRRGIFLAQCLLGLRPKEARELRARDYQPASGEEPPWITVPHTKTRRVKRLPVPPELEAWIATWVPADARLSDRALFVPPAPRTGGRVPTGWSKSRQTETWNRAAKACGVQVPMYEGTKHSRATDLARRGTPERLIQAILGHADVRSTRRYARLADQAIIDVLIPRRCSDVDPAPKPALKSSK